VMKSRREGEARRSETHFNCNLWGDGEKELHFVRKFQPSPARPSDISNMKINAGMKMLEL
jgi:hypothetical protein